MLEKVIEGCRARIAEGDCPTTLAFTIEQLEEAVVELANRSAAQRDDDARDAARYDFLCMHPDWHFIEQLCQQFAAESYTEFKRALDAEIDRRMNANG